MPADRRPRHRWITFTLVTLLLATGLTYFYCIHEQLPRAARALSSLILARVAIVDGLCYLAKVPGIYGKLVPIFLVNWVSSTFICGVALVALGLQRRFSAQSKAR